MNLLFDKGGLDGLEHFYKTHPVPADQLRIPLNSFVDAPEASLARAHAYLEEYGVIFITDAGDDALRAALEEQVLKCVHTMDPNNGDAQSLDQVVRQAPAQGVWGSVSTGALLLAQQEDTDEHPVSRLPLQLAEKGVPMTFNPVFSRVNLWAMQHRPDLAAILFKLTYPNGTLDHDTCTYISKQSPGKFDMVRPSYDVHECGRYRAFLSWENGRRMVFLPKSHTDAFAAGKKEKKRKRTVLPFAQNKMSTKEAAAYGVYAPSKNGTLVIFKDVVYFEHGQMRAPTSSIFRVHLGVHDPHTMTTGDRKTLAVYSAASGFTPTVLGNNALMATYAKGQKYALYTPIFNGKRQSKFRRESNHERLAFKRCRVNHDQIAEEYERIRPLTRHMLGDTQEDPFKGESVEAQAIWNADL